VLFRSSTKKLGAETSVTATSPPTEVEERRQREVLSNSFANAHARRNCQSDEEFNQHARADKVDGVARLRAAASEFAKTNYHGGGAQNKRVFPLAAMSLVAVFGGPGEHGYGWHICEQAEAKGLLPFRCLCGYRGSHRLHVVDSAMSQLGEEGETCAEVATESGICFGIAVLGLGARFPFSEFSQRYDGSTQTAVFMDGKIAGTNAISASSKRTSAAVMDPRQPSIQNFAGFKRKSVAQAENNNHSKKQQVVEHVAVERIEDSPSREVFEGETEASDKVIFVG